MSIYEYPKLSIQCLIKRINSVTGKGKMEPKVFPSKDTEAQGMEATCHGQ